MKLLQGDCLELMKSIPDGSIDMICCDLPYGTTQCKWDTIIPFEPLWKQYKRVIKTNGAIVLNASQPFTSALVMSNPRMFGYEWVWKKQKATRWLDCKKRPLQEHEQVLIFYKKQPTYNSQMANGIPYDKGFRRSNEDGSQAEIYGTFKGARIVNKSGLRHPRTILEFNTAECDGKFHATQKPVALMEYLIKTYTNEGETVLDNCMGSGTTGIACLNLNRNFIGMELDEAIFATAKERIANHKVPLKAVSILNL